MSTLCGYVASIRNRSRTQEPRPRCARPGSSAWSATRSIADPVAGVDAAVPAVLIAAAGDHGAAEDDRSDAPAAVAPAALPVGVGGGGGRERGGGDGGDGGDSEDGLAEHGVSPFVFIGCALTSCL